MARGKRVYRFGIVPGYAHGQVNILFFDWPMRQYRAGGVRGILLAD
jgi:hypothetical protein